METRGLSVPETAGFRYSLCVSVYRKAKVSLTSFSHVNSNKLQATYWHRNPNLKDTLPLTFLRIVFMVISATMRDKDCFVSESFCFEECVNPLKRRPLKKQVDRATPSTNSK